MRMAEARARSPALLSALVGAVLLASTLLGLTGVQLSRMTNPDPHKLRPRRLKARGDLTELKRRVANVPRSLFQEPTAQALPLTSDLPAEIGLTEFQSKAVNVRRGLVALTRSSATEPPGSLLAWGASRLRGMGKALFGRGNLGAGAHPRAGPTARRLDPTEEPEMEGKVLVQSGAYTRDVGVETWRDAEPEEEKQIVREQGDQAQSYLGGVEEKPFHGRPVTFSLIMDPNEDGETRVQVDADGLVLEEGEATSLEAWPSMDH